MMPVVGKFFKYSSFMQSDISFKTIAEWAEMIKIEHTVFALPFVLSGFILSTPGFPSAATLGWTVLAFASARCAAMTLNRLIDADIDAKNPRTKDRAIPAKKISKGLALTISIVSFAVMLFAASMLPPICLWLSPIAVFWLSFYSFTKRFTWLCHIVLGIALGGAALGGWVAASGALVGAAPWLLALAVTTWVAGFDIIYACQDTEFDSNEKLHSIPSRFGVAGALKISRALHVCTVLFLLALGLALKLALFYYLGLVLIAGMLVYEHRLVKADDLSRVNAAFFTVNGVVSIISFLAFLADKLMPLRF
jgi:4-hydroxybenzoate polyprenyltransferase